MAKVQFSPEARRDLVQIMTWLIETWLIEHRSATVASDYETQFLAAVHRLEEFPGTGAPRPLLGSNIRIIVVLPYLVIYRGEPESEIIEIVRIIHGSRNITTRMLAR